MALVREYEREVTREMHAEYGITWNDACGDASPLLSAIESGQSPAEFVQWWGERYGLVRMADIDLSYPR
ncbi:MAG TPA: hypothetical protein VFS94_12400 [Gemmatimonadales bacterium]|nr:hypothetical protein [Gemmatimonadales bacterium]